MEIQIKSHNKSLAQDIMESQELTANKSEINIGNATVLYKGIRRNRAEVTPDIIELAITFGSGIASGIIANWLYNILKNNRVVELRINKKYVKIQENDIKISIEENIEIRE